MQAHRTLQQHQPSCRLINAPRHPERRDDIRRLIETHGFHAKLRSLGETANSDKDVLLLDTLGELAQFYAHASVAFIGGSLLERGGQNPLEAVHAGCSVCFGPSMYNFTHIAGELLREPFCRQIPSPDALAEGIGVTMHNRAAHHSTLQDYNARQRDLPDDYATAIVRHLPHSNTA